MCKKKPLISGSAGLLRAMSAEGFLFLDNEDNGLKSKPTEESKPATVGAVSQKDCH